MTIKQAAANFLKSEDLEPAIISSTKASWGGSGYSVELFESGSYRVLWDNFIGNRYDSEGVIVGIPTLDDSDWDGEDESESFFDNAVEALEATLESATELEAA